MTMKQDILSLMMAYPEYIVGVETRENKKVYLIMKSGKRIIYDDKTAKNFEQKLANPDLQDMMEQEYPLTPIKSLMPKNQDPGRGRVYSLLSEVYGGTRNKVESNLVNVNVGNYSRFNKNNKAAEELKKVMQELMPIAQKNSKVAASLFPSSGTYNYRVISGTGRLSPHAFGIAIDLARDSRDYWQWASEKQGAERIASYPQEIVDVFEKHNFIWGGKWYHFDILHFEYRPEIILKARYFGNKNVNRKEWYEGAPVEDSSVKEYIKKIEEGVK
nr:M15 family metallopeptidase [Clostridium peptidivorans]